MSEELYNMHAVDLIAAYRAKRLSPVEVTRAVIDRINAHNEALNCFCFVDEDSALATAAESEARWVKGEPKGLVDGVPTSIKDLLLTKGWPTLKGSKTIDPNQSWEEDSPAAARLREHGAVILGKTTTSEFGWKGVTDNPLTGITRNPWNLEKTPGGSSGGAAAALAAGMGPLAVGTDGAGSVRIPASLAGIFGLKPSFGVVPRYPSQPPPLRTLSHAGPMARSVSDATLILAVISAPDHRDALALNDGLKDYRNVLEKGVKGLRVAFSADLGYARVHPEVAALVAKAAGTFSDFGAEVEEKAPGFDDPWEIWLTHFQAAGPLLIRMLSEEKIELMDPGLKKRWRDGQVPNLVEFLDAMAMRERLGQHMAAFHQNYDLLLTPTIAVPAFDVGLIGPEGYGPDPWTNWLPFTYPINLTMQPAALVPCGFTSDGLPVGLHIVAPMHRDDLVLRAARAYEEAFPTWDRRPQLETH